ncbi:MAG: hypothetical protein AAFQ42_10425 [Pseudomonadota bacterium]
MSATLVFLLKVLPIVGLLGYAGWQAVKMRREVDAARARARDDERKPPADDAGA